MKILDENQIKYQLLENTKDVWCRDYMPLKIADDEYVQFRFAPRYLDGVPHLKTDSKNSKLYPSNVKDVNLVINGGSIVKGRNVVFFSSRIADDNNSTNDLIGRTLSKYLKVEKAIPIKNYPGDFTGHLDALVRFIDDENLFYSDVNPSNSYRSKFLKSLQSSGLNLIPFSYFESDRKNKYGYYTALGCYLNFLQLDEHILLPQFDHPMDKEALEITRKHFPDHNVVPVLSNEVAEYSGVLNCISWS